jgi:hypothetical protein
MFPYEPLLHSPFRHGLYFIVFVSNGKGDLTIDRFTTNQDVNIESIQYLKNLKQTLDWSWSDLRQLMVSRGKNDH